MDERTLLTYPTWERYVVMAHVIQHFPVQQRRRIFQHMRTASPPSPDLFFPHYGITLSEFAVWHILGNEPRVDKRSSARA